MNKVRKINQFFSNSKTKKLLIVSFLMLFFIAIPILNPGGSMNITTINSDNTKDFTNAVSPESSASPTLYIESAPIHDVPEGDSINLGVLLYVNNSGNLDPCNDSFKVSWSIYNGTSNLVETGNLTYQFGNYFDTQINPTKENNTYLYPYNETTPGDYNFVFNASGMSLNAITNPISFKINPKLSSSLISTEIPSSLRMGQTISLRYKLNVTTASSLEGLPIVFKFDYLNQNFTYTKTTDENGTVVLTYRVPTSGIGGPLKLTVVFSGAKGIYPCSISHQISILQPIQTNLNFEASDSGNLLEGVHYYSVILTDDQNQPLSDMNVTFEVLNAYGKIVQSKTSYTDDSGTSSVSFDLNEAGAFVVEVLFDAYGVYSKAEPINVSVQVMTPFTMVIQQMPIVAIIAGIIIIGVIVYQRVYLIPRRKRRLESLKMMHQKFTDAENIQYILILTREGLAIFSRSFTNIPLDGSLISGFLSAISSFGTQIGAQMKNKQVSIIDKGLEELSYQQFKIVVNDATLVRTAVLLRRNASDTLKDNIKRFNYTFQENYKDKLQNYDGEVLDELPILELIEKYLELDLLYPYNVNLSKIDEYMMNLGKKSIKYRILRQSTKPPFHNTFYIRDMMDYFVEKDLSEVAVFNEIADLIKDSMIFAMNPIIQSLMDQFRPIIDKLSPEAKKVITTLKEGRYSIKGIKNVSAAVVELQELRLLDANNHLTDTGETVGSLLQVI